MSLLANAGKVILNESASCSVISVCYFDRLASKVSGFDWLSCTPKKKKSFRPLSKTVRFNVLKVIPAGSSGGGKKAFTGI